VVADGVPSLEETPVAELSGSGDSAEQAKTKIMKGTNDASRMRLDM
jgi:hypothetical protein